uniref:putative toxin-antitoxin system toxin component, PIN family n=1 Tax=Prevotella sp. TaxID=59823 RepID=UPI003FEDA3E9
MVYAVIDTNIIVSSFITRNHSSSTRRVINSMLSGKIKPLYNDEILDEYFDVLNRSKFHLSEIRIIELLNFFKENGINTSRFPFDGDMPDEDDRVFYEVSLSEEDSFLVTGNLKHFPKTPKVITAAQMIEILDNDF